MTRLQSLLNLFNELPAATTIEKLRQIGYETTIHHHHTLLMANKVQQWQAFTKSLPIHRDHRTHLIVASYKYIWHSYLLSKSKQSSTTTEYLIM